jgi:hypothetical protein
MTMKPTHLLRVLPSLLVLGTLACSKPAPKSETPTAATTATTTTTTTTTTTGADSADLIVVEVPGADGVVASPLRVAGRARGFWFFEATFPIKLLDANGKLVSESFVQASAEWMTTEFVPFEGKLIFEPPATATGTLVFEKANASGLPQHDDSLRMPVRFAAAAP